MRLVTFKNMNNRKLFELCFSERSKAIEYVSNHPESVEGLLKYKTCLGNTVLHLLSELRDSSFVELLIRDSESHIGFERTNNYSPFDICVKNDDIITTMTYLNHHSDSPKFVDLRHLIYSIERRNEKMLEILIEGCLKFQLCTWTSMFVKHKARCLRFKTKRSVMRCTLEAGVMYAVSARWANGLKMLFESIDQCKSTRHLCNATSGYENLAHVTPSLTTAYLLCLLGGVNHRCDVRCNGKDYMGCINVLLDRNADPLEYVKLVIGKGKRKPSDVTIHTNAIGLAIIKESRGKIAQGALSIPMMKRLNDEIEDDGWWVLRFCDNGRAYLEHLGNTCIAYRNLVTFRHILSLVARYDTDILSPKEERRLDETDSDVGLRHVFFRKILKRIGTYKDTSLQMIRMLVLSGMSHERTGNNNFFLRHIFGTLHSVSPGELRDFIDNTYRTITLKDISRVRMVQ